MIRPESLCICTLAAASIVASVSLPSRSENPSVTIQNGTVVGQTNTTAGVENFIGIPYAQPPIGNLRLRPPQTLNSAYGTMNLPTLAKSCPQMNVSSFDLSAYPQQAAEFLESNFRNFTGDVGEDCLLVNVQRPATLPANSSLPVLFWIYGGGYEIGSTQIYNGINLVARGVNTSRPFIFVAANYRGNAFGFLPGKQLQEEGSTNLGLRDQRKALEWTAENIAAFGGDPNRVTIWGESAGSASVWDQILIDNGDNTYHGKALFHGAIMDSASTLRTLPVNSTKAQEIFDRFATAAGCDCNSTNVLDCLRAVPYDTFKKAVNVWTDFVSYTGLDIFYYRRPDSSSTFYANSYAEAAAKGEFARVPVIIGNQEDEGTLFSLQQTNLTTTDDLINYYTGWFPTTSRNDIAGLIQTYPDDPAAGSPFGTGDKNQLYPQYKRMAAVQGDYIFTLATRVTLANFASSLPGAWSYLATYLYGFPLLGTFHTSDIPATFDVQGYGGRTQVAYYFNFLYWQNPNGEGLLNWPEWDDQNKLMINISTNSTSPLDGNFRRQSFQYYQDYPTSFFL